MNDIRQKTRSSRDFYSGKKGESPKPEIKATESLIAECNPESPTGTKMLMEEVCKRENLKNALKRVKAKKGSAGIDGMKVEELGMYLKENWLKIKEQLLSGTYKPNPVKRVEIPKKSGGTRMLGVPTVSDRIAQMVIKLAFEPRFCNRSHNLSFYDLLSEYMKLLNFQLN